MNLKEKEIIIYDFETNGFLDHPTIQPIEIAVIHIDKEGNITEYNEFIKLRDVNEKLTAKITEITTITNEILEENGIDLDDAIKAIGHLFLKSDVVIVGHNIIGFDNQIMYPLMIKHYERCFKGIQIFDTAGHFKGELIKWKKFDNSTYFDFHKKVLSVQRRGLYFNLTKACEHYGVEKGDAMHRAIADVRYNLQVFIRQLEKLGEVPEHILKHKK